MIAHHIAYGSPGFKWRQMLYVPWCQTFPKGVKCLYLILEKGVQDHLHPGHTSCMRYGEYPIGHGIYCSRCTFLLAQYASNDL